MKVTHALAYNRCTNYIGSKSSLTVLREFVVVVVKKISVW